MTENFKGEFEMLKMYVAYRKHMENPQEIIIKAQDEETAQRMANKFFGCGENAGKTFIAVHELEKSNVQNIYYI